MKPPLRLPAGHFSRIHADLSGMGRIPANPKTGFSGHPVSTDQSANGPVHCVSLAVQRPTPSNGHSGAHPSASAPQR